MRHGISTVSTAGRVEVSARVENGTLHLAVSDDGPGMSHPPARPGTGTGLRNTRERLAELCGPGEHLSIAGRNGAGTTVRIAIPAVRDAEAGRG